MTTLVAVLLLATAGVGAIQYRHRVLAQHLTERAAQVTEQLPQLFSRLNFRQPTAGSMKPDMVWRGASSSILEVTYTLSDNRIGTEPVATWLVLAQTQRGRFFEAQYQLRSTATCNHVLSCVGLEGFRALEVGEVRERLFRAGKAELYEKVFGKPAPPKEEAA